MIKQITDLGQYFRTKIDDIKVIAEERMAVCTAGCAAYTPPATTGTFRYSMCRDCGCVLEAKVLMPGAGCPQNLWSR